MSLHHNARSCSHSRALMVDRIQRGDPVVRVEAELGVSPRTVYTWLGRYCQQGLEGLRDSSSSLIAYPGRWLRLVSIRLCNSDTGGWSRLRSPPVWVWLARRWPGCSPDGVSGRLKALDPTQPPRRYPKEHPG